MLFLIFQVTFPPAPAPLPLPRHPRAREGEVWLNHIPKNSGIFISGDINDLNFTFKIPSPTPAPGRPGGELVGLSPIITQKGGRPSVHFHATKTLLWIEATFIDRF